MALDGLFDVVFSSVVDSLVGEALGPRRSRGLRLLGIAVGVAALLILVGLLVAVFVLAATA